jgi:hypothetical protein
MPKNGREADILFTYTHPPKSAKLELREQVLQALKKNNWI